MNKLLGIPLALVLSFSLSSCAVEPTFPGDKVTQAARGIAKDLYDLDIVTAEQGRTLGAVLYLDTMLDEEMKAIPRDVHEKLGHVTYTLTRVALSTDKDVNFIVVALRGRQEQLELQVIRRVDDIKRAHAEALSITESMSRTVFNQLRYDPATTDEGVFHIQEITMPDFLNAQVLQRLRFKGETQQDPSKVTEIHDGTYIIDGDDKRFEYSILTFEQGNSEEKIQKVVEILAEVLGGYDFADYRRAVVRELLGRKIIELTPAELKGLRKKELEISKVMEKVTDDTQRSQTYKNALEVIGFKIAEETGAQSGNPSAYIETFDPPESSSSDRTDQ